MWPGSADLRYAVSRDFAQGLYGGMTSIAGSAIIEIRREFYDTMFREARGALNDIVGTIMQAE